MLSNDVPVPRTSYSYSGPVASAEQLLPFHPRRRPFSPPCYPTPDILLVSQGQVVFLGPREEVMPFFARMGLAPPPTKTDADFLQEVTSSPAYQVGASRACCKGGTGEGGDVCRFGELRLRVAFGLCVIWSPAYQVWRAPLAYLYGKGGCADPHLCSWRTEVLQLPRGERKI